jgi:DNA invertase Pin-like site-specific DNA recombinase
MKRAVLYARVSTDAQQKEGTIESQGLELKRQIAAAGDVLVKEYIDEGYSGTLLDRPALEELRRDVKTDLFDAVYFLDTDRIARDVAYQTIILGELIKHGKRIIIKGKDYVNNPENKFTVTVLGAVAELERAKIIERTTRGRLHRLRMGELSSNVPHQPRSSSTRTRRRSSGRSSRCSRAAASDWSPSRGRSKSAALRLAWDGRSGTGIRSRPCSKTRPMRARATSTE